MCTWQVNVGESVVSGIFIKNVIENGPADKSGKLKVGDRILAVDGTDIREATHEMAVATIKKAGSKLTLLVQSLNKVTNDRENGFDFINKNVPPPVTPSKTPEAELIQVGLGFIIHFGVRWAGSGQACINSPQCRLNM